MAVLAAKRIGFVEAEYLHVGDVLRLQSGEKVALEGITCDALGSSVYVYNFEVEDFHTYYVGEDRVLVHNKAQINTLDKGASNTTKTLFRGERPSVKPEEVFENGFTPKGTHNDALLHTKSNTTAGNFVSTSPDKGIANGFVQNNGYIYELESSNYVDINKTYGNGAHFPEQNEFSIPGGVSGAQIKGAWVLKKAKLLESLFQIPDLKEANKWKKKKKWSSYKLIK